MMNIPSPEEYLPIADRLSAAPRILPRLLSVLEDPASDVSQVIELISFDQGLTSKVLRASNSAFVGLPEPARDVGEAVNQLGVNFIYQLATAVCGAATFRSANGNTAARLWQRSVTAGLAAQLLAEELQLDRGLLFTAAILHDIGQAVFAEQWKDDYWLLVDQTRSVPSNLPMLEEQAFRLHHGELGGRLLAHWKFPPSISASVWHHHAPVAGMPFERETACLTLADAVAEAITDAPTARVELFPLSSGQERALAVFGFTAEDLKRYLGRTQENFEFVNAMCQIGL
jgi:putative nucleotidyltransferase with HDIG domain